MTKTKGEQRCGWCGGRFVQTPGRGRPRRYCKAGCRQQAHLARRRADGHRLGADEIIVRREDLETMQAAVYGLQAALEDVVADLEDDDSPDGVRNALEYLQEEAAPLAGLWITPVTGSSDHAPGDSQLNAENPRYVK